MSANKHFSVIFFLLVTFMAVLATILVGLRVTGR